MIELNLLPDVKLEYIKTQRIRRLTLSIAFLVAVASIGLLVLLLGIEGLQKKHLSDLSRDIKNETSELQGKPDINQILTVQNQLDSLTALHAAKPAAARVFGYLNSLTPAAVSITNFSINFAQQNINLTGASDALSSINQYIDTLKYTTYTTNTNSTSAPAFSNVVLSSFGLNSETQDRSQAANYTITLSYDPNIFDITQQVTLTVPPSSTTTRATLQQPSDLFKAAPPAATPSGGSQ